jgi:hypothetical protein
MQTTLFYDRMRSGRVRGPNGRWRVPPIVWVLACIGAALVVGCQLFILVEPSGNAIRRELKAAAAEMQTQLTLQPSPKVLAAMRRDFAERDVRIATSASSSIVAVTLQGLDRETCVEATTKARRIDGLVVVVLRGYGGPDDCGGRNEMPWWIMP